MPVSDRQDEAYELKDRLVEYDRDSASRTKVIDDQNDYYDILQANAWLSDEERQDMASRMRMLEAEQETSSSMMVTFDVFGRRSAAPCIVVVHDDEEEKKSQQICSRWHRIEQWKNDRMVVVAQSLGLMLHYVMQIM
eukprot:jgi/Picre1/35453/NNA_002915.t1